MDILSQHTRATLQAARQVYGAKNQILVSVEELCELASVCAKYPRYDTHEKAVTELRGHVLEELGDVFNAIDHIEAIFGVTDQEVAQAAAAKGERVARWLSKSSGMEITTQDREVGSPSPCQRCIQQGMKAPGQPCYECPEVGIAESTEI